MRNDGLGGRGNLARLPKRYRWPLEKIWPDRVRQEFALGNLTRCDRDVLLNLPTFQGPEGELFPSHAAIARRTKCNERTVRRALKKGAALNMVLPLQRRRKAKGRWVRTSNLYVLNVPEVPAKPGLKPILVKTSNGQFGRVQDSVSKKEAFQGLVRDAAGSPDLLAARRQSIQMAQLAACR